MTNEEQWLLEVKKNFLDKKIVLIRYMNNEEQEMLGWSYRAIVFQMDDGTIMFPSMDDEGNDAGAIFTSLDDLPTIPVMR